jgi:TRAP-type C4-dicarboxylate transport system permease small subunit
VGQSAAQLQALLRLLLLQAAKPCKMILQVLQASLSWLMLWQALSLMMREHDNRCRLQQLACDAWLMLPATIV